ncbi:hypothetical protein [Asanoa iriomotensis]|uniref:Uncharacterized protein n=1 Tax=Asanoa iriomotensis TaxID=234613 RepID=A0ABQ4BU44_9ACTN|nr:hypothetical protein [Asanoa iriomotensis]GIF54049.1 hypothetical protein Air01nite_01440 [Asanoa iriomotensis]
MSGDTDRERFADYLAVLGAAGEALRSHTDLVSVGALVKLYGSLLKLDARARRVVGYLEAQTDQPKQVDVAHLDLFHDFFRELDRMGAVVGELDVALLDIYHPGLMAELAAATGQDNDVVYFFNRHLAPKYGLDVADLPPALAHLLANYNSDYGYSAGFGHVEGALLRGRSRRSLRWRSEQDEDPVLLGPEQLRTLGDLVDGLGRLHRAVGGLVRENWRLAELADTRPPTEPTVKVIMGDNYQNITGSTLVNRSLVQESFQQSVDRGDRAAAEALRTVADAIARAGNDVAADHLNAFNEELAKKRPNKALLKTFWTGLVAAMPAITQLTDAVAKIESLF